MALAENMSSPASPSARQPGAESRREPQVVLGEDWERGDNAVDEELRQPRAQRTFPLRLSTLTRRIVTINLVALNVLVATILLLTDPQGMLVAQRARALATEAELVADVFEAQLPRGAPVSLAAGDGLDPGATLDALDLPHGREVRVFDTTGRTIARALGESVPQAASGDTPAPRTWLVDGLSAVWSRVAALLGREGEALSRSQVEDELTALAARTVERGVTLTATSGAGVTAIQLAATPILREGRPVGAIGLISSADEEGTALKAARERMLRLFLVATLVSIALSVTLASTITNPINDLADAAEVGRNRESRAVGGGRIRIPDLSARPDEIGRLSRALRDMVAALYDRIDANEQFAADVAHEIKNPLASLRSAVGTLRHAHKPEQREKLLDIIEHDVRRLDRLVSDISNASRLDSELVREEEEPFDLTRLLANLCEFHAEDARAKGIEFITDLPQERIVIQGLEGRLAQVFVNLITNAISFCEPGDAIRVWARKRDNRVLVVVEDTGIGIPEGSLKKIFKRFYSERPAGDFGNNSGLGLAISKQIVEAHGGVIWAENIRPTDADPTSEPLGARFVVGLPL